MKIGMLAIPLAMISGFAANVAGATITATSVSLSYASSVSGTNETYSFLGPGLNIVGGSSEAFGPLTTTALGTPFNIGVALIVSDIGGGSGSGVAGGVSYPSLDLTSGSMLLFGPFTLSAGHLSFTVPETITGTVSACSPYATCINSGGPTVFSMNFTVHGLLTVTASQGGSNLYNITSAQFTTAPEPGTLLILLSGVAGLLLLAYANANSSGAKVR